MKIDTKGIILFILAILVLLFSIYAALKHFDVIPEPVKPNVCINEDCVWVEVADTPSQRWKGLMDRKQLDKDKGMLFVFEEEDKYAFWMKSTLIPLDIIWIDKNFNIIHIETAIPCGSEPCPSYLPESDALYVLEVNAGFTENKSITPGQKVTIEI